jgi:hypothetical protein
MCSSSTPAGRRAPAGSAVEVGAVEVGAVEVNAVEVRLGELLRLLRRARGLSVGHVVAICGAGFGPEALIAWEQAELSLPVERLDVLAGVYGVGTAWLLEEAIASAGDGGPACSPRTGAVRVAGGQSVHDRAVDGPI